VRELAEMMVGRPVLLQVEKADAKPGVPVLEITDLDVEDERGLPAVRGLSLTVRAGEIVGVAGVEGNGQSELVEAVTGLRAWKAGDVRLSGESLGGLSPRQIGARGVAHVPADRWKRGLVLDWTLEDNLVFGRHAEPEFTHRVTLDRPHIRAFAETALQEYDVRPPRREARARQLSGGNQQKVIVAREFSRRGDLLVAAHPTRGVDLGAIEFIHKEIVKSRDAGRAVLVVSADLGELLSLSDRIVVLYEGRIVFEAQAAATNEKELGLHMTGRVTAGETGPAGGAGAAGGASRS
jgi:simple sugar transport system ATP-binding protein